MWLRKHKKKGTFQGQPPNVSAFWLSWGFLSQSKMFDILEEEEEESQ